MSSTLHQTAKSARGHPAGKHLVYPFYVLLALVLLSPLPLGSNRPLPAAFIALTCGVLLVVWAALWAVGERRLTFPMHRIAVPLGLTAYTCLWVLVQWSTWTPEAWHHPVWTQASGFLNVPLEGRITVNPHATVTALMHLVSYIAVFWLALQLSTKRQVAHLATSALVWGGAAYALYGLIVYLTGNDTVLTFRKWAYFDSLTSTFVNRNSFATYAGLCLIAASGLLVDRLRPILRMPGPPRRRAAEIVERLLGRDAALCAAMIVITSALVLTMSRAGVICSIVGTALTLSLMLPRKRAGHGRSYLIAGAFFVAVLAVFAVSGDPILERYLRQDAVLTENSRWPVYRLVFTAIADAPLLGTGYGTFPDVFTGYTDAYVSTVAFWDKAHNTYLENMLELGVPAALSLFAAIGLLAWSTFLGARIRRRGRLYPAVAAGASLTVALHSLVDFSLQIPAVAVTYAFILGVGVAHSWPSRETASLAG